MTKTLSILILNLCLAAGAGAAAHPLNALFEGIPATRQVQGHQTADHSLTLSSLSGIEASRFSASTEADDPDCAALWLSDLKSVVAARNIHPSFRGHLKLWLSQVELGPAVFSPWKILFHRHTIDSGAIGRSLDRQIIDDGAIGESFDQQRIDFGAIGHCEPTAVPEASIPQMLSCGTALLGGILLRSRSNARCRRPYSSFGKGSASLQLAINCK